MFISILIKGNLYGTIGSMMSPPYEPLREYFNLFSGVDVVHNFDKELSLCKNLCRNCVQHIRRVFQVKVKDFFSFSAFHVYRF